jgi:hypothetical protein
MTREDRWIVSLDEIRALRWECPRCQVAVSFSINQTINWPAVCPGCGHSAFEDLIPHHKPYAEFARLLKAVIQSQQMPGNPGAVRLEFLAEPGRASKNP